MPKLAATKVRRSLSGKVLPPGHQTAPSWHELVQPGPKGDPAKKWKRQSARRRGTFTEYAPKNGPHATPVRPADQIGRPSIFRRAVTRLRSARSV